MTSRRLLLVIALFGVAEACSGSSGADDTRIRVPDVTADFTWGGREVGAEPDREVTAADAPALDAVDASVPDGSDVAPEGSGPEPSDVANPDPWSDVAVDAALEAGPDVPAPGDVVDASDVAPDVPVPDLAEPEPDLPPVPDTAECSVDAHCSDGKPCTIDTCVGGACTHTKTPDNGPCEDGDTCTTGDYCQGGLCWAGVVDGCDDGNVCTFDQCVQNSGCLHTPKSGGACQDGDPCSGNDVCANGVCQKGPLDLCPVCGDGKCGTPYETCAQCVQDCGACSETQCADGVDEDWDGKTDCADSDCTHVLPCYEAACGDAVDNDGDGATDCTDPDCGATEPCIETSCTDTLDNDGDGATDCADSQCAASAACVPAACSSVVALTCGQTKSGTVSSTNHLSGYTGCSSQGGSNGDTLYAVVMPAGKVSITAKLTISNSSDDLDLYLLRDTCAVSSCAASSTGMSTTETVSSSATPGQIFFVVIEKWSSSSTGTYSLSISCN